MGLSPLMKSTACSRFLSWPFAGRQKRFGLGGEAQHLEAVAIVQVGDAKKLLACSSLLPAIEPEVSMTKAMSFSVGLLGGVRPARALGNNLHRLLDGR